MRQREQDIEGLEVSLNELKESMGYEYAQKHKDFEVLKRAFDEQSYAFEQLKRDFQARTNDLEAEKSKLSTSNAENQSLVDKVTYLENVITELEEKNKRLTDMLNTNLYNKA